MRILLSCSLSVFLFLIGCHSTQQPTRRDVVSAQKLIGVQFSKSEIDTMLNYLQDNRKGYDSMRKYKLPNEVAPAVRFDPRPDHFSLSGAAQP